MAWLGTWKKRVKFTTDQTDIDADLTNFPILLYLSTSSGRNAEDISFVFDELTADANRFKIAVTTSDEVTECYVEIEKWDDANEKAWLWVKAPSVLGASDTDFYLYYDSTHADNTDYVGDIDSTAGAAVWDTNFKLVHHLVDATTSTTKDSTSNNNDGAKKGAGEPAVTTSGKIANAQDFDGTDDIITITDNAGLSTLGPLTLEAWIKTTDAGAGSVISKDGGAGGNREWIMYHQGGQLALWLFSSTASNNLCGWTSIVNVADGAFHHVVMTWDGVNATPGHMKVWVDGVSRALNIYDLKTGTGYVPYDGTTNVEFGRYYSDNAYCFDGIVEEGRISNSLRSDAWIKASYETERDNLLDWGTEESISISLFATIL